MSADVWPDPAHVKALAGWFCDRRYDDNVDNAREDALLFLASEPMRALFTAEYHRGAADVGHEVFRVLDEWVETMADQPVSSGVARGVRVEVVATLARAGVKP